MNISEFLDKILFTIAGIEFNMVDLIGLLVILIVFFSLGRVVFRILHNYLEKDVLTHKTKVEVQWLTWISLVLLAVWAIILLVGDAMDPDLYTAGQIYIKPSTIIGGSMLLIFAHLVDVVITSFLPRETSEKHTDLKGESPDDPEAPRKTKHIVRPTIYTLVILMVVHNVDQLNFEFYEINRPGEQIIFRLSNIIGVILIFLIARLIMWGATEIVLANYYKRKKVDIGSRYAANQLLKYFIFTIALLFVIESSGINLTLIWGGAAALLVGIGLGLQQTFNDLTCGFILLFERTVEINDVVEFDGMIGIVKKIGVRTSLIETRDDITVIVPNSKLVGEYVINWSHYRERSRFRVLVGVAYGSDVELVKQLMLQAAAGHEKIMQRPTPFVRFADFGDSSLNFELHFWSKELMRIENVKSDIRFELYRLFNENQIVIPFPQRDVWVRKQD